MSRVPVYALMLLAAGAAASLPAYRQAVISTRAGVVHFFEGSVTVGGQPLESRLGVFASIPDGGELRTAQGRAEVLMTPGVILRVGQNSAIRMVATSLADTQVELLEGSAILDSAEPAAGTSVTLIFKDWKVQQAHQGSYRVDSNPPRLQVRDGEVKVANRNGDAPVLVGQGMELPFAAVLAPEKSTGEAQDALNQWAEGRAESISADNSIAEGIQDPATMSDPYGVADSFTYFPMLGYPALSPSMAAAYGALGGDPYGMGSPLYQPGFYSIYLPGYTYRPALLGLPLRGVGAYAPLRLGAPGSTLPHLLVPTHPMVPLYGTQPGIYPGIGAHPETPGIGVRPANPGIGARPAPAVGAHPVIGRPVGHK